MRISPITPSVGAEISGVDLANLQTDNVSAIKDAFVKHHVLVFRDQGLTRDQHKDFGRLFGELHIHPSKRNGMNHEDPELFIVNTKPDAKLTNGEAWHSDVSCEEIPPLASILYVTKCPENGGGDTMFANMHAAFDELSPELQTWAQSKPIPRPRTLWCRGIRKPVSLISLPTAVSPHILKASPDGKVTCYCRGCISERRTIRAFNAA